MARLERGVTKTHWSLDTPRNEELLNLQMPQKQVERRGRGTRTGLGFSTK